MPSSSIRALLDDGPRAGQDLTIDAAADGGPPQRILVEDPLGERGTEDPSAGGGEATRGSTAYQLQGRAERDGTFVYRTGQPD